MRCWTFVLTLALCACTRPAVPDAGQPVERGTDLRSAINTVFPEYRGVQVLAARAAVTRTFKPAKGQDVEAARAAMKANGFDGEPLTRSPFSFEPGLKGDTLSLELRLPLKPDELPRILSAPAAMSSEAMAHWLPRLDAPKVYERFELELVWQAVSVQRADFLVWQLVDGALKAGFVVELPKGFERQGADGGPGAVPEQFLLELVQKEQGLVVELERKAERARLRYLLTTFERR